MNEPYVAPLSRVIGDAVRSMRRSHGWSQDYLAEQMRDYGFDWSRNVITNLESGRTVKIDVGDLLAIAVVLQVGPIELIAPALFTPPGLQEPQISILPGLAPVPQSLVRLWLRGTEEMSLQNVLFAKGGEIEEKIARLMASEAFDNGSYLNDLREDLVGLPTNDAEARGDRPDRAALHEKIRLHMSDIQVLLFQIQQMDKESDHGDD